MSEYVWNNELAAKVGSPISWDEATLPNTGVYQALADPKRIAILCALAERPYHVVALAETLHMPQSTISRHLRILRQESLVATERDGSYMTYRLADERIMQVIQLVRQIMSSLLQEKTAVLAD